MPYRWETDRPNMAELHLWPHQSLTAHGFSVFMASFFLLAILPVFWLIGTVLLWGLLPFILAAIAGLWWALRHNSRERSVLEVLTLGPQTARLTRHNPRGPTQDWQGNTHWLAVDLHVTGGPVPHYVTLRGGGRQVEIGAFLSEEERKALFVELSDRVRLLRRA
ncbi:hypothetical protein AL036_02590 [Salipiger aestuarii]|uniref:Putative membrane protein n=1 Tax=Salipiger aestuarii TaxID=568098 RepID=A0A327YPT3_9RHOB|nr:DUF2244 domain-containing protein [Salipiger aestuarii]EIE49101.1 hypothetical protein C357_19840 [Citreicella sp. 357]KAA8609640.1 hypothetical protein AL036_02590 [Salipiger aestuarii]KAA8612952.1 hypothetical protein AL037_06435 [Salipiger aestuarii]KAB2543731.1 hypothetical protein AL035_00775 [Salipiger aestuarii]RAK22983.1 putative membrane protein [Salipiger aestuarii]